jgi:S-DNA-T family DNA segregation ATPase FtsK/SpoIIIE
LANHLRYFKLKLSQKESNPSSKIQKKEIKTDLGTNSGANTGGSYNLEEFAITDDEKKHPLYSKPSKYEVDKEALKPTISHSSEINLDPVSK